jgi:cytochrome c biogenesis protein CcdA
MKLFYSDDNNFPFTLRDFFSAIFVGLLLATPFLVETYGYKWLTFLLGIAMIYFGLRLIATTVRRYQRQKYMPPQFSDSRMIDFLNDNNK